MIDSDRRTPKTDLSMTTKVVSAKGDELSMSEPSFYLPNPCCAQANNASDRSY